MKICKKIASQVAITVFAAVQLISSWIAGAAILPEISTPPEQPETGITAATPETPTTPAGSSAVTTVTDGLAAVQTAQSTTFPHTITTSDQSDISYPPATVTQSGAGHTTAPTTRRTAAPTTSIAVRPTTTTYRTTTTTAPRPSASSPDTAADYRQAILRLVNQERTQRGLSALVLDETISRAAQIRATEIIENFSHTRPNGSSFSTALDEAGVKAGRRAENIAAGQRSPEAVMQSWMNSEGHRANILNPNLKKLGVGYAEGGRYHTNWVQLFTG